MDNRTIAEQVFQLQLAIRYKNGTVASALQRAILGLLDTRIHSFPQRLRSYLVSKASHPRLLSGSHELSKETASSPLRPKFPRGARSGCPVVGALSNRTLGTGTVHGTT